MRLLHVRGGVSAHQWEVADLRKSSPRPWRCFPSEILKTTGHLVFSTSVEVFPFRNIKNDRPLSLLHVRGGVSTDAQPRNWPEPSSPCPWRCFLTMPHGGFREKVFSTSVEVFPCQAVLRRGDDCLLHVRGGVSTGKSIKNVVARSSPHPWRCFPLGRHARILARVFSTSVEVFSIEKLAGR